MAKLRLLFHESSHAVVASAACFPVLCLIQNGDFGMLQLAPVTAEQLKDRRFRNAYAIASVAGAMGESIKFGGGGLESLASGLGQTDFENLASIGLDLVQILAACHEAERYLKANWQAVERVAAALEKNLILTDADIKAAAGDLPGLFEKPVIKPIQQSFQAQTKSRYTFISKAFGIDGGMRYV